MVVSPVLFPVFLCNHFRHCYVNFVPGAYLSSSQLYTATGTYVRVLTAPTAVAHDQPDHADSPSSVRQNWTRNRPGDETSAERDGFFFFFSVQPQLYPHTQFSTTPGICRCPSFCLGGSSERETEKYERNAERRSWAVNNKSM